METIKKKAEQIAKFIRTNQVEFALLVLILLLGCFLRFYRLPSYMTFLGDEGRDALAVKRMIVNHKFRLIGPVTSIGNMYLGPLYYYLMLPAMILSRLSPVGPAAMVATLGIITIGLVWWIGREWFNREAGLMASFLYAISPVVIIYSQSSWNPNVMPFFALLTIYGVYQFWLKERFWWLPIIGITLSFCLQSHYLGLLLIPVIGLFWLATLKAQWKNKKTLKRFLLSTFCFLLLLLLLTIAPLVWFDLRHNFINFRAFKTFFTVRQTTVNLKIYKAIPKFWSLTNQVFTRLLAGKDEFWGTPVTALIVLLAVIFFILRRSPALWLLVIWLGIALGGLGNYKQHIYDHYFGFFFPVPFLLVGWFLGKMWNLPAFGGKKLGKFIVVVFLLFFAFLAFKEIPLRYPPNNQLTRTKEIARFIIEKADSKPFNLALIAERNYQAAYAYFMEIWGTPTTDIEPLRAEETITDQLFVICEQLPCQPINHPLAEIANFGWAEIAGQWEFPWGVKVFKLTHTK